MNILMSVPPPVGSLCRVIAVDHRTEDVYLLAMHDPSDAVSRADALSWLDATADTAHAVAHPQHSAQPAANGCSADRQSLVTPVASDIPHKSVPNGGPMNGLLPCFSTRQSRAQYVADVRSCLKVSSGSWPPACMSVPFA